MSLQLTAWAACTCPCGFVGYLTNRQFFMVCTLIDHRNNVKMFKTQVEPRTAGQGFHCKVLTFWRHFYGRFVFYLGWKEPTLRNAATGFPAKWRLRKERRNSILMTRASDWSCHVGNLPQPFRSTTGIWVVRRHQYGISALVSRMSFRGETSGGVVKCRLFLRLFFYHNWQFQRPFPLKFLGKSSARERGKQIAPPSRHLRGLYSYRG